MIPTAAAARSESAATVARRRALARKVGAQSLVLLKNDHDVLPFRTPLKSLAVIGPLADAAEEMRGPWPAAGVAENHVSVLAGLRAALPETKVTSCAWRQRSRAMTPPVSPRPWHW